MLRGEFNYKEKIEIVFNFEQNKIARKMSKWNERGDYNKL
jgi:hypothetical protein